jgi:hypothetical protein
MLIWCTFMMQNNKRVSSVSHFILVTSSIWLRCKTDNSACVLRGVSTLQLSRAKVARLYVWVWVILQKRTYGSIADETARLRGKTYSPCSSSSSWILQCPSGRTDGLFLYTFSILTNNIHIIKSNRSEKTLYVPSLILFIVQYLRLDSIMFAKIIGICPPCFYRVPLRSSQRAETCASRQRIMQDVKKSAL